jgi:hypothetical protein
VEQLEALSSETKEGVNPSRADNTLGLTPFIY